MNEITPNNSVQELLHYIPELKEFRQLDQDDAPSVIFDTFGDFLLNMINSKTNQDGIIRKSFDFINQMMESKDVAIQNLPVVGVFEVLAGSKKAIETADTMLNENGREWFNKVKQRFNPK